MKKLLLLISSVLCVSAAAQKETDKWYFGVLAKVDFTTGSPVASSGPMNTSEGSSSVSSPSGSTRFFTDGQTVWDAAETVMPNGTGLMGEVSSSQSAMIVPSPTSNSQYYVFTTDADGGPNGFRYSVVDMTLNGGMGDVVVASKNTPVLDSVCEKIAAIRSPAGDTYWVVVHQWGNNKFYAYRLTPSGLQPPVISSVGTVHSSTLGTNPFQNTYGQMKFNMCGDKLALAIGYQNMIEIVDFNMSTGVISNPQSLPQPDHVYGIEFSPNSTFLYATCYDPAGTVLQYNVSSGIAATIAATRVPLSTAGSMYGMQLASNGNIYVVDGFTNRVPFIESPDLAGFACGYDGFGIDIDPAFNGCMSGLTPPSFMQSYLTVAFGVNCTTGMEENELDPIAVFPNPSSSNFKIDLSTLDKEADVVIYDHTGKLIEKRSSVNSVQTFGENYAMGVYFVCIQLNGEQKAFKVVKI